MCRSVGCCMTCSMCRCAVCQCLIFQMSHRIWRLSTACHADAAAWCLLYGLMLTAVGVCSTITCRPLLCMQTICVAGAAPLEISAEFKKPCLLPCTLLLHASPNTNMPSAASSGATGAGLAPGAATASTAPTAPVLVGTREITPACASGTQTNSDAGVAAGQNRIVHFSISTSSGGLLVEGMVRF